MRHPAACGGSATNLRHRIVSRNEPPLRRHERFLTCRPAARRAGFLETPAAQKSLKRFLKVYEEDSMAKVIGIDLGTTNSCVAVMDGKNPKDVAYTNLTLPTIA